MLIVCKLVTVNESLASNYKEPIKCISLNNRPCQTCPRLVDINSNGTLFYLFTLSVNKSGGSCNTIDDPYAGLCVSNKVKNMNVKVFNVRGKWNKIFSSTWTVKCRLNESVCNSNWNWI